MITYFMTIDTLATFGFVDRLSINEFAHWCNLTVVVLSLQVVPTPVARSLVVTTSIVTRVPVTVTVTSIKSEFQFVTRTEIQYVTLTHTSRTFTHETLTTTVTSV